MEKAVIHFIILGVISGLTKGAGVLPDGPLNAAVGETVMFTITPTPSEKPFTIAWTFRDRNIITFRGENTTGPEYEGRITLFISTGSLELRNLTCDDSGEYTVVILPQTGAQIVGSTTLKVEGPVSNVMVTPSSKDLVEFNSSVSLSCSASGCTLSFLWLDGTSVVTESDRFQLTDGGATLTIVNVTRSDQGRFRCHVSNPVKNGTSDPVNLSISYGPENVTFKLSPSQEYYEEGSEITLSCSAVSKPSALFYWFLNGIKLSHTGSEINIRINESGNYSCQAFNQKTLRYDTSSPLALFLHHNIHNVTVTPSSTDLVEFNSSISLSCYASGSSISFLWLNGTSEVTASDRFQLTDGNSTLTIANVTRYDQGPFRCHVFNPVSTATSDPVTLSISYGPGNVILMLSPSQEDYVEGSNITLSCSAVSRPSALFYWLLNGDYLSDIGPELKLVNIQMNQSGNYGCQAFNNKTLRYETSQSLVVSVMAIPDETPGCAAGCIAGIVIACLVVCAAAAGGGYYIFRKKTNNKAPPPQTQKQEVEEPVYEDISMVYDTILN
ncbi:cell adhesion molecule CEACAM5-like [Pagrus major]|uniref:cell adhesion molecule CEACAM5-like n=1 Tax=Pagrus major TaxID=143350 RepID=UPI003CC8B51C